MDGSRGAFNGTKKKKTSFFCLISFISHIGMCGRESRLILLCLPLIYPQCFLNQLRLLLFLMTSFPLSFLFFEQLLYGRLVLPSFTLSRRQFKKTACHIHSSISILMFFSFSNIQPRIIFFHEMLPFIVDRFFISQRRTQFLSFSLD